MPGYLVVSDLHMGNRTKRDNFLKNVDKFSQFLDYVRERNSTLVIAGDLMELWQCDIGEVLKSYPVILEKIRNVRTVLIPGNHDWDLNNFFGLGLGLPFDIRTDGYLLEDQRVFVQHGHQYDEWNDPRRNMKWGRLVAFAVGMMEDHDADIEGKLVEIWHVVKRALKTEKEPSDFRTPAQREPLDPRPYVDGAKATINKSGGAVRAVILGHTHRPGKTRDGSVWNCGCWVSEELTYIVIEPSGTIRLVAWPSNTEIANRFLD